MTIDLWTDPYVKRHFLCATFHYEKNLQLKEIVLGIKSMDFMSTNGENIRNKLRKLMENFGINDLSKIKFITDRGSNIKSALTGEIRINCINHLLSNTIDASFDENEEIVQIVSKCKSLVKYFKKENLQHLLPTSLKNYCPTRWNSYLQLFKSIADNWAEINEILSQKGLTYKLNGINFNTLNTLFQLCVDVDKISRKLQGTNYPTMCYVVPLITRLKMLCHTNVEDADCIADLKESMSGHIETKIIDNITIWHKTACFLFPPAKNIDELRFDIEEIKDL